MNEATAATHDQGQRRYLGIHSQNAQCTLFHLLGLSCGFVEARLEVRPSMFPSHLDGGSHIVCQDNKLRWSAVNLSPDTGEVRSQFVVLPESPQSQGVLDCAQEAIVVVDVL
jgi:hypothetical protein